MSAAPVDRPAAARATGIDAPPPASVGRAVAWMTGALFSFLTSGIAGRELSAEVSLFQIVFFRNTVALLVLTGILCFAGWDHLRTTKPRGHVARNVVHFAAQYLWFAAVAAIPLAEVFAIEFTMPIWTALLAMLFLGERLTRVRVVVIALGFLGVMSILRPGVEVVHPAAIGALGAALGFATTYVITKSMVATERPLTILVWMTLVQLPIGVAPAALDWTTPSPALWPWVVAVGLAGLGSHYCISRAMAHADATVVAPLDFMRLPLAAVVAWFAYAEPLDPFVFVGAGLIFAGNWLNVRRG